MVAEWVRFFVSSPDLRQNFEIRWCFTATHWHAIVHPMDGPTRKCSGRMDAPFGESFAQVFGAFESAHVIEAAMAAD